MSRVQEVLSTLRFLIQTFEDRREKLSSYYKNGQEVKSWDFPSILVFVRLEGFIRRLETIEVRATIVCDGVLGFLILVKTVFLPRGAEWTPSQVHQDGGASTRFSGDDI